MIAEASAVLTVGSIELLPGSVHRLGFRRAQFGMIAIPPSILAGGNVAQAFRSGRITRLRWCECGGVTGQHPIMTLGHVPLMIVHSQRHRFGFGKFRRVAGIVTIPALGNVARVDGKRYFRQLRWAQLCPIAGLASSLTLRQSLREI